MNEAMTRSPSLTRGDLGADLDDRAGALVAEDDGGGHAAT